MLCRNLLSPSLSWLRGACREPAQAVLVQGSSSKRGRAPAVIFGFVDLSEGGTCWPILLTCGKGWPDFSSIHLMLFELFFIKQ